MARSGNFVLVMLLVACAIRVQAQVPSAKLWSNGTAKAAEYRAVAQADLARRLATLSDVDERPVPSGFPYDVQTLRELRTATIGYGFEVFTLPPAALKSEQPVEQGVVSTGTWRFMVMVGSRPVALMTLASMSGEMRVVEVGAAKLAKLIEAMASRHANSADRLRFIRVYEAHQDILEVATSDAPPRYERLASPGVLLEGKDVRTLLP